MNQTKERAQNGLVFIADAIALLISYYLSGALWLHMYKGMNLNKVIGNLNDNVIIVVRHMQWHICFIQEMETP